MKWITDNLFAVGLIAGCLGSAWYIGKTDEEEMQQRWQEEIKRYDAETFEHDAMCGHPDEVDCMSCGKVLCWDCTGVEVFDETWTDEHGTFTNNLELCRGCFGTKEDERIWLEERKAKHGAETFEAPYVGGDALLGIGKDTSLSSFTPDELAKSSSIHGDFDSASLNYSGHQNLLNRAEDYPMASDYVAMGKELADQEGKTAYGVFIDADGKPVMFVSEESMVGMEFLGRSEAAVIDDALEYFEQTYPGVKFIKFDEVVLEAESLEKSSWSSDETLILVADYDTTIDGIEISYEMDYDGTIEGADEYVVDVMEIKQGDIVAFHHKVPTYFYTDDSLTGYVGGDYYDTGEPTGYWRVSDLGAWSLLETIESEEDPNWAGDDEWPRIIHTPGGRSYEFTITGMGHGDTEEEAFRNFITSHKIGTSHKWKVERKQAEYTYGSTGDTLIHWEDYMGYSSPSMPPLDVHFGADDGWDEVSDPPTAIHPQPDTGTWKIGPPLPSTISDKSTMPLSIGSDKPSKPITPKHLKGTVRTISGKPHKTRILKKDKDITPEEAATRLKLEACHSCGTSKTYNAEYQCDCN